MKNLITPQQAVLLKTKLGFNQSECMLYYFAKEGKIPHVRIGRRIYFEEQKYKEWLENYFSPVVCVNDGVT